MSMYTYIRNLWKQPKKNMPELWRERLIAWRREPSTTRIERPTRLDKARSVGYKAKQGVFVVRQRVLRGGHSRPKITGGRRTKHARQRLVLNKSYKSIAEERVNRKFVNCEVLNSYEVAKDGKYYWFEVIMVDRKNPSVLKNKQLSQIAKQRGRVYRGKTSAAKKSRSLRKKGKGVEKMRPSKGAAYRRKVRSQ